MCDNRQVLRDVFSAFDTDKSGTIDAKELQAVMKAYFESVGQTADDKRVADAAAVSSRPYMMYCSQISLHIHIPLNVICATY